MQIKSILKQYTLTSIMELTIKEQSVITYLSEQKTGTKDEICQKFEISHMTVVRAMAKYGYYSSFNMNSSYYTLIDIPEFDNRGLWFYNKIGFSKYKNIDLTIISLIENSTGGYFEKELNDILHTKTGDILRRLYRQNRLSKMQTGRQVIYLSVNNEQRDKQIKSFEQHKHDENLKSQRYNFSHGILPEGIDFGTVILTLVFLIDQPGSSAASLSRRLQGKDIKVTAEQIRTIIDFYGIKKKLELFMKTVRNV